MNRWTEGDGERSGVPTEVLSGESLGGCGGIIEVFWHKKRGPAHFILSWSGRTSVTYQKRLQPYSSFVSGIGQSGAINMLH